MSQSASIDQRVLKLVIKAGQSGIMPGELQRRLDVGSATITRALARLVAEGRVVRPTSKGPVYAPEFAPAPTKKPAAGRPPRPRGRRPESGLKRTLGWMQEHKVIPGVLGAAVVLGILRPERVQQIIVRHLAAMARTGPDGANLVEKMYAYMYTTAVGLTANAMSPEKLQAEHDKAHRKLAENYARSWNLRLEELERARLVIRQLIYEASPEEQAHFFLAAHVLLPEPGDQPRVLLGLRREWQPGPRFPDEARREIAPAGSMVTVQHFPRLLTIIAAELDERIREHRVEPLPIQPPQALPQPPMNDAERAKRIQQAQAAEAKRQKDVARVQAAYGQGADEEPGEQGPGVFVIR